MQTKPQHCVPIDFDQATRFDLVQLMYPGRWARMITDKDGNFTIIDQFEETLETGQINLPSCVLVGSFDIQTRKFALFDCWQKSGIDICSQPYHSRYRHLILCGPWLPSCAKVIPLFSAVDAKTLWNNLPGSDFRGLIWRRSTESVADTIYRSMRD